MLWINFIMDPLAALALATDQPTESLLKQKSCGRNKTLISRTMMKNILGHAVYQLVAIFILVFADYHCPVWREAVLLQASQHGAVGVVFFIGAGELLWGQVISTTPSPHLGFLKVPSQTERESEVHREELTEGADGTGLEGDQVLWLRGPNRRGDRWDRPATPPSTAGERFAGTFGLRAGRVAGAGRVSVRRSAEAGRSAGGEAEVLVPTAVPGLVVGSSVGSGW
ncbi:plasma membrane calcium-transporting ATPase 4-like [Amphiprion ocellaris]|uniref:plasma membrane calcium-transporting ATPase 4-like n=1 Tax=Amphiprion ocellaris TaxID=80972 RepID=UPI002410EF1C|nr:plasma membrane calcium-transporting ATPase 4-like [Amphiprion ocellaris]